MSHLEQRSEKTCLNCGASLTDRYCQTCGQENIEPKPTLGHLLKHFFSDITHFDGRFFSTMKMLIIKPGFLSSEYLRGKRTSYLDPIRMFLFISATFFLLPFNFDTESSTKKNAKKDTKENVAEVKNGLQEANKNLRSKNLDTIAYDTASGVAVTRNNDGRTIHFTSDAGDWAIDSTVAQYDSTQKSLPGNKRDGWIKHYFKRKMIAAREFSHDNAHEFETRLWENFFHSLHWMLFVTLPLIAFIIYLLYIRRRKQYYYVSHIIFTLHYYCVVFISLVATKLLSIIGGYAEYAIPFIHLGYFIYLLVAMKRFYHQGWFKTFIKYMLLLLVGTTLLGFLTIIALVNSVLNVAG